jgi:hypothetical protein
MRSEQGWIAALFITDEITPALAVSGPLSAKIFNRIPVMHILSRRQGLRSAHGARLVVEDTSRVTSKRCVEGDMTQIVSFANASLCADSPHPSPDRLSCRQRIVSISQQNAV